MGTVMERWAILLRLLDTYDAQVVTEHVDNEWAQILLLGEGSRFLVTITSDGPDVVIGYQDGSSLEFRPMDALVHLNDVLTRNWDEQDH